MASTEKTEYAIGDTIYYQHVYEGRAYRNRRWYDAKIIDQTSRSWVTNGWPEKLPKNGKGFIFAAPEQALEDTWDERNRDKIAEAIRQTIETDVLRKVTELIGYDALPGPTTKHTEGK
jgi:hypothetical protein